MRYPEHSFRLIENKKKKQRDEMSAVDRVCGRYDKFTVSSKCGAYLISSDFFYFALHMSNE